MRVPSKLFFVGYCRKQFIDSNQIAQIGYVMDNLTTVRILGYYKKAPSLFLLYQVQTSLQLTQKYMRYLLGKTVSFNYYFPEPSALNVDILEKVKFTKLASGGSFLVALDD